jgi:hypothetical protein
VGLGLVGVVGLGLGLLLSRGPKARDTSPPERAATATSEPAAPAPTPRASSVGSSGMSRPAVAPGDEPADPAAAPSTGPTIEEVFAARNDTSTESLAVLLAGVESDDPVVVAESTLALIGRKAVSALPVLLAQDIPSRPAASLIIIDGLGRLAAFASPEERSEVVDHLVALMHAEKQRRAPESQGNLLQIYEALGQTGDPRAIPPLEQELVDTTVPTAPKVVIVQALVALRATQSRGVLERVSAELSASTTQDAFEAELRQDLLAVIRDALVKLS